jgi:predicted MFS family arabinose efflux permease
MFGLQHFNTLFGLTFLSHQVGAFVGAWLGGVTFDMTGSYAVAWGSMIAVGLCAAGLQWFMDDRREVDRWPVGLGAPMYTD